MVQRNKLAHSVVQIPILKEADQGSPLWARGYLAVSSGSIIDEMFQLKDKNPIALPPPDIQGLAPVRQLKTVFA